MAVLGQHPIVLVQPESLDSSALTSAHPRLHVERFDDHFFAGRAGYNRLMLSAEFYQRFADVEYVLIHQLDAFVFRDELAYWCKRGHDYIGAPWLPPHRLLERIGERFKSAPKRARHGEKYCKVGNGGFSLRKIRPFIDIAVRRRDMIDAYLARQAGHRSATYEDGFWGMQVAQAEPWFSVPDHDEALRFAMDHRPWSALELNNGQLPFGCHGFEKRRVRRFWTPLIAQACSHGAGFESVDSNTTP